MIASLVPGLIVVGLILLNGLFVAAEFAVVAVPRAALERRASRGDRWATFLRNTVENPLLLDRYIATAQLGITLASLGLGMYGEHLLAGWLAEVFAGWGIGEGRWIGAHALASFAAIAFFTYWHVVVGEMVPKGLALQRPELTLFAVAPAMRGIELLMYPLIVTLNTVGNAVLALMGVRRSGGHTHRSVEELGFIVRESQEGGLLRKEAAQVVQELLEFGDLTAREVMIPRVRIRAIAVGATPEELRRLLEESPHTRYPVYRDSLDRIIGCVHVRDLVGEGQDPPALDESSVWPIPFVPESLGLDRILEALHRGGARMAVVMDEHGGIAGLVTVEDLFDEVVGDLDGPAELSAEESGGVRALGRVRLETLGEMLGRTVEHDEVDTLSGLVLDLLGRPAQVGDRVSYRGLGIEVLTVAGRGVGEALVKVERPNGPYAGAA